MAPNDTKKGSFLDRFSAKKTTATSSDHSMFLNTDVIHEGISDDDLDSLLSADIKSSAFPPKNPLPADYTEEELEMDTLDNVLGEDALPEQILSVDDSLIENSLVDDELTADEHELLELETLDDVLNDHEPLELVDPEIAANMEPDTSNTFGLNTDKIETSLSLAAIDPETEQAVSLVDTKENTSTSNDGLGDLTIRTEEEIEASLQNPNLTLGSMPSVSTEDELPELTARVTPSAPDNSALNNEAVKTDAAADVSEDISVVDLITPLALQNLDKKEASVTPVQSGSSNLSGSNQSNTDQSDEKQNAEVSKNQNDSLKTNTDDISIATLSNVVDETKDKTDDKSPVLNDSVTNKAASSQTQSSDASQNNTEDKVAASASNAALDAAAPAQEVDPKTKEVKTVLNESIIEKVSKKDSTQNNFVANVATNLSTEKTTEPTSDVDSVRAVVASSAAAALAASIVQAEKTESKAALQANTAPVKANAVVGSLADSKIEEGDTTTSPAKKVQVSVSKPIFSNPSVTQEIETVASAKNVDSSKDASTKANLSATTEKSSTGNNKSTKLTSTKPIGKKTMTNESQAALLEKIQVDIDELKRKLHGMNSDFYNAATDSAVLISQVRELETTSGDFGGTYTQSRDLRKLLVEARKTFNQLASGIDMLEEALETDIYQVEKKS